MAGTYLFSRHSASGVMELSNSLAGLPGTRRARKRPIEVRVNFAHSPGVCETLEGAVNYGVGDAILIGAHGERWPVARETFAITYEPIEPTRPMEDGKYRKRAGEVLAVRLTAPQRVELSGGRGVLSGRAGDWIVDHGDGDLAVVSAKIFMDSYELLG